MVDFFLKMLKAWIFDQHTALVPHDPLGRNDFLHGRQVNNVVGSV